MSAKHLLIACVFICIGTGVFALRCLSCQHAVSPTHCLFVTQCAQNETCFLERYTSLNGETLFNMGCQTKEVCQSFQGNSSRESRKRQHLSNSHTSTSQCVSCCQKDICNRQGCGIDGYPSVRGPVCFNCPQSLHPQNCDQITTCNPTEACHIREVQEFGERVYTTGCISNTACAQVLGNPFYANIVGKRHEEMKRRVTSCADCCVGDLCNTRCFGRYVPTNNPIQPGFTFGPSVSPSVTHPFVNGHAGKEYIIAFPSNNYTLSYAQVMITTMIDTTVTIESPHPGVSRTVKVKAANGTTISLPTSLALQGNAIEQKGVLIKSTADIAVQVFVQNSQGKGEAYSAIPVRNLGTSYLGAAFLYSFISVIALQDNTHVNITPGYTTQFYNGITYSTGETISIYLSRLSTFQIIGNPYSYNTNIFSDRPVSILSGCTCCDVVHTSKSTSQCNYMIENIPPTNSLGNTFITPHFPYTLSSNYFAYNRNKSYEVHIQGRNDNFTTRWNQYNRMSRNADIAYRVTIGHPGVIVFYSGYGSSKLYPSKIVIPALSQYSNNYRYITPSAVSFENHVSIIIKADYMGGLRLDNRTIYSMNPEIQGIIAGNGLYNVLTFNVTSGQHSAHHVDSSVTFGMIAYGYRSGEMYGFPVGLRL